MEGLYKGKWQTVTIEFEFDKIGSTISTCTNKRYVSVCPKWSLWLYGKKVVTGDSQVVIGDT